MMGSVECFAIDEHEEHGCCQSGRAAAHEVAGNGVTQPCKGESEGQDYGIGDPDSETEQFEKDKVEQIRAWRGELEEVLIDAAAFKHSLRVHPEKDLISPEKNRDMKADKQIETEISCRAEQRET